MAIQTILRLLPLSHYLNTSHEQLQTATEPPSETSMLVKPGEEGKDVSHHFINTYDLGISINQYITEFLRGVLQIAKPALTIAYKILFKECYDHNIENLYLYKLTV